MFALHLIVILIVVLFFMWFIYLKQLHNLVRPLTYYADIYGSPNYIAGSTSGSPLSELGSHCGFKSVPGNKAAGCTALYATITSFGAGRIYDFAVRLYDDQGKSFFKTAESRQIHLSPNYIEEQSWDRSYTVRNRLYFLQRNLALWETQWEVLAGEAKVKPACKLLPVRGRDLENPYPHSNGFTFFKKIKGGLQLTNYHRVPGQKLHAFFLPSEGSEVRKKELLGPSIDLKAGEKQGWSVIISFSADSAEETVERAERALRNLKGLKGAAEKRWGSFEKLLPVPYQQNSEPARVVLKLAAWALENSLYYPRNKMRRWGSVPAKVYFPFIWGWDTPQHVLGLSEWNPKKAGDILLTQLDGNFNAPREASFRLKIKGITFIAGAQRNLIPSKLDDSLRGVLDFYSQPPLQSWAAVRVYERLQEEEKAHFLQEVLTPLRENLRWWEENRRLRSGFFSYINGLESGLDDSPRFYPPSFLPSFIIGVVPRFFCAVDLNSWLFQSYINAAYLSKKAGLDEEGAQYEAKGFALKERIDRELWSEKHQAWLDRRNGSFIEVFTPSIWWPAFVGAASDLEKTRAVIEKYLLNRDKFWGRYGIPSVAFDDVSYNGVKDGYYWRGQIWMINNYSALEVLFRYGYSREAEKLHDRILKTIYRSGGLYETYNAVSGEIGWSSRGPGDPSVMQFGMSSGWATQIIFCRYQHFRYIFPETKEVKGHIQWAATIDREPVLSPPSIEPGQRKAILQVDVPGEDVYNVPRLFLKSEDSRPLLESANLRLRFDDKNGFAGQNGVISFTWKGESFLVRPGRDYCLKPFAASGKISSA